VVASAFAEQGWPVTVSVGAVTFIEPPESVDALLTQTDDVMYSSKREGKGGIAHTTHPGRQDA
jgi:PleD family two-component response regulator